MKKNIKAIATAITMILTTINTTAHATESSSYLDEESQATIVSYAIDINMNSLSRYLKLDACQTEVLAYATDNLEAAVANLANKSEADRPVAMHKAFDRNLQLTISVLTKEQYRQYLTALNGMLNNKGLNTLLCSEAL